MDNLSNEVLKELDKLKKDSSSGTEYDAEVMELLFIASLLEEENISVAS